MLKKYFKLLVNAISLRREFITIINRVTVSVLLYSNIREYPKYSDTRVSIHNGLFQKDLMIPMSFVCYAIDMLLHITPYNRFEPQDGLFTTSSVYKTSYRK